ncbi:aromatic-ring-hydroxylating dioxygenase subunit beta [Immundisolibacter cernigliae]|uniref:Aromatic-ring-hydroxylating dioxygenase subunit beta n=1 Tax=Immundisolibacter cernigliae TaxID=1810504 RepID=A0A1B1YVB3_9GAMM|nr:3-phenylpropionate/cinnamic acid dioxygenase subunit beta [Immundisolibacter cernigliae]ANX04583.1 aromatic-ring-hydroxylating dioxygenase subunit beta [Immundisolibacter cernigliae]
MSAETHALLSIDQHLALTQTLYREARLLDEERFADWLDLLADDVHYRMPLTARRFRADRSAALAGGAGYVFDDDKGRLGLRVQRLESGLVWAEDPRNRVRRIVSNVEIYRAQTDGEATVHSVIEVHRSRMDAQQRRLTAARTDLWRLEGGGWRLVRRLIGFDHPVVIDSNLNVFF